MLLINAPGIASGSIEAQYANENFLGMEAYLTIMMEEDRCRRIDLIAGYQFMRLDDRLLIESSHFLLQLGNTPFDVRDRFETENDIPRRPDRPPRPDDARLLSLDALGKVALGVTRQRVISPAARRCAAGAVFEGGLLAEHTNIGQFSTTGLRTSRSDPQPSLPRHPQLSFHAGYSLIWWSDVVTSGRQIDTGVNPCNSSAARWSAKPAPPSSSATSPTGCKASTSGSTGISRPGNAS